MCCRFIHLFLSIISRTSYVFVWLVFTKAHYVTIFYLKLGITYGMYSDRCTHALASFVDNSGWLCGALNFVFALLWNLYFSGFHTLNGYIIWYCGYLKQKKFWCFTLRYIYKYRVIRRHSHRGQKTWKFPTNFP